MEPKVISKLVMGQKLFDSAGYADVKVTKDGVSEILRLPIRSTGVAEFQEYLEGKAPKPPTSYKRIKKDSPEGRQAGLTHDAMHIVFDLTDDGYIDAMNKHNQDFTWQIVVFAIDSDKISWEMPDGKKAESAEDKKAILKSNGITDHHINKIFKTVQALTQFDEDRADFLSGN